MSTHSSVLAWGIPWTEDPGGLQSIGSQEADTTEVTQHTVHCITASRVYRYDSLFTCSQVPGGLLSRPMVRLGQVGVVSGLPGTTRYLRSVTLHPLPSLDVVWTPQMPDLSVNGWLHSLPA